MANKLSLNVAKTEFMSIYSKQIENEHIKQVFECKTLGVKVDQHLSWKISTENICKLKKITSGFSALIGV